MNKQLPEQLRRLVAGGEEGLDLAAGALLIASLEYPELDAGRYLADLDRMGREVNALAGSGAEPLDALRALNRYLFEQQGFAGNHADYYDPRNSFLNDVLERRMGIPVTLSVVYMEVARRAGLEVNGVPFPGHFLVKLTLEEGEVLLDPYAGGVSLSLEDVEARLAALGGGGQEARQAIPDLLNAASKRDILLRMASNLRVIYRNNDDYPRLLALSELLLVLAPEDAELYREQAVCYEGLEYPAGALQAYRRYLDHAREPRDRDAIRERMVELGGVAGNVH